MELIKLRNTKVYEAKKRKKLVPQKFSNGTITDCDMMSISKTLNEIDKYPERDNFCIVINNPSIHTSTEIDVINQKKNAGLLKKML